MSKIVEVIKQISNESTAAGMPVALMFGTVISIKPLTINVEQKLNLTSEFLILTNAVKDHEVEMTIDHETEPSEELNANHTHNEEEVEIDLTHKHKYTGKKKFMIHNGLKVGESVVLLRMQAGQKFLVIDRLGANK